MFATTKSALRHLQEIERAVNRPGPVDWLGAARAWLGLCDEAGDPRPEDDGLSRLGEALKLKDAIAIRAQVHTMTGGRLSREQFQQIHRG